MNLLIVAATKEEMSPFAEFLSTSSYPIDILISGVGMMSTAFALGTRLAEKKYDAIVNVGIGGSFDKSLPLGSLVRIHSDCLSELGVEDGNDFITIDQIGLGESSFAENARPFTELSSVVQLKHAKGITVNQVHGCETSIHKLISRLNPDIESMEGAACFYAAKQSNIYSLQVRSISNYVEKRDRSNWQIELAILNLNEWIKKFTIELFS